MTQIHLLDIPEFSDVHAAFTSYVLGGAFRQSLNQMYFTPCDIKFGKTKIIYRVWLSERNQDMIGEFFIVASDERVPMLMVSRVTADGTYREDATAITNYTHTQPFNVEGVLKLIKNIPKQDPVKYYLSCNNPALHGTH